ncbi:DUF3570 domain-containing protein [Sinimarinibacterium thermocellulolyticum]|uniref:DUF3570 domain-containing protein n=1 Tax=Sinimarinibacterium thermocellulolyticum TaxID=3170016 RepID=A0ABV2ACT7_9GAMM
MQLNPSLNAAALALLGLSQASAAADAVPGWTFEGATLIYSEADGRVQAAEPRFRATRNWDSGRSLSMGLTLDALTGASPNGAAPASTPQTFTTPSGNGSYTIAAGETPLDDTFRDTRVALDASLSTPLGRRNTLTTTLFASNEYDYLSIGAGATIARDFNLRNTTVSFGVNVEQDRIEPVGGAPQPLSRMPAEGEPRASREASVSKTVIDVLASFTQVLSPVSLVTLTASLSKSDGYLSDPYKLLSVVGADGEPLRYVYEGRPDTRLKQALYGEYKRFVYDRDAWTISLRLMSDDWGVFSQTVDTTYRWNFGARDHLEPHLRYYRQSEADFYRAALFDGEENQIGEASADPRLGAFDAITVGLKYGHTTRGGLPWWVRLEGYTQLGRSAGVPAEAADGLAKFDLEPELTAVLFTTGFRFGR